MNKYRDSGIQELRDKMKMNLNVFKIDHIPLIPEFAIPKSLNFHCLIPEFAISEFLNH